MQDQRDQQGRRGRRRAPGWALVVLAMAATGCSGSSTGERTAATAPPTTSTARARVWSATITGEHDANGGWRQGLARSGDGWLFTTNNAIYRADQDLQRVQAHETAIPQELAAQGYDHLGDGDVADGVLWLPVEKDDKDAGTQVTARYDEETLAYLDSVEVPQHHNSFVAVGDDGTVYSTDQFTDDTIVRYRVTDGKVRPLRPLTMSRTIERIQGGDVAEGAIWLSTDDDHNGVYRVDLETGAVTDLGSAGHVAGEGEGIDATDLPGGLLHVLVGDEKIAPMWVVSMAVSSQPAG